MNGRLLPETPNHTLTQRKLAAGQAAINWRARASASTRKRCSTSSSRRRRSRPSRTATAAPGRRDSLSRGPRPPGLPGLVQMADRRRYGAYPGFDGYTAAGFRRLSKAKKAEAMVSWFGANFEDPAHRTPYEFAEGGYQWIHRGPYDASEGLRDEFADVEDLEAIELAVDEIQSDGLYEWAPVPDSSNCDADPDEAEQGGFPYTFPIAFGGQPSAGTAPMFSDAVSGGPIAGGPYPALSDSPTHRKSR